jgi:hypothetical protein
MWTAADGQRPFYPSMAKSSAVTFLSVASQTAAVLQNAQTGSTEVPVGRALMSGLSCGVCRWPSWVFAYVSGANLVRVLEAHHLYRLCLNCSS